MSEARYRLADSVVVEPLVSRYPAWWCVFAPLPAALHAVGYQMPAMRSYLRNPGAHVRAARTPALAGGPYLDVDEARAPEVERLLAEFEREYAPGAALARDYWAVTERLHAEALGQSLEPFYAELPAALRGLVELAYDYFNRPALRVSEGMLYATEHFKRGQQSVRLWHLERDAQRTFYMSTPRLAGGEGLELAAPFDSAAFAFLGGLDAEPRPRDAIRAALGAEAGGERLDPFLARAEAPLPPAPPAAGRVRVRHVGHACVLVEGAGVSILVDPFVSPRPRGGGAARLSFADLPPRIDYALVTHAHPDHFDFETLLRLRGRVGTLVVPRNLGVAAGDVSLRLAAERLGFARVRELDAMDAVEFEGGRVVAAPFLGEHGDVLHGNKAAYVVRLGGEQIFFAADSTPLDAEVFRRVRGRLGDVGTVFLNTETEGAPLSWPFDALFPKKRDRKREQTRRCRGANADEGLALVAALGARRLFNYAMGLEPWLERIVGPASPEGSPRLLEAERLLAGARALGVEAARARAGDEYVLGEG